MGRVNKCNNAAPMVNFLHKVFQERVLSLERKGLEMFIKLNHMFELLENNKTRVGRLGSKKNFVLGAAQVGLQSVTRSTT